jgi:lysophospholipase L1-like esterase
MKTLTRHALRACALLLVAGTWLSALAQTADPDPARFAAEIKAFEERDRKDTPPTGALLFVGSSTIRLWPTAERFPGRVVINRGFGGSHVSDVNHYLQQTVLKYRPRLVVLYAGDNDVGAGKSAERVRGDYQAFVERIRAAEPDTHIAFLAIKPSLARWTLWPAMKAANEAVRSYSATVPRLHFIDVATPMLGADGRPKPELFVADGLHMSPAGYDIWTAVVSRSLGEWGQILN